MGIKGEIINRQAKEIKRLDKLRIELVKENEALRVELRKEKRTSPVVVCGDFHDTSCDRITAAQILELRGRKG